jgi:hypothetical protein
VCLCVSDVSNAQLVFSGGNARMLDAMLGGFTAIWPIIIIPKTTINIVNIEKTYSFQQKTSNTDSYIHSKQSTATEIVQNSS